MGKITFSCPCKYFQYFFCLSLQVKARDGSFPLIFKTVKSSAIMQQCHSCDCVNTDCSFRLRQWVFNFDLLLARVLWKFEVNFSKHLNT